MPLFIRYALTQVLIRVAQWKNGDQLLPHWARPGDWLAPPSGAWLKYG